MQATIDLKTIETPIGNMVACATSDGICLLEFSDRRMLPTEFDIITKSLHAKITEGHNNHFTILEKELNSYFEKTLKTFTVPLVMIGSDFQKRVWQELLTIPYGKTRSYKDQSAALGNPDAIRAVAHANGMNKIAIIIPCHRVIGSNGELIGYGGGLWRKKHLLALEKHTSKQMNLCF